MPPRVLLFGTGAIGIFYAIKLNKANAEVTLVCRSNFDRVVEHGIHLESELYGYQSANLPAVRTPADAHGRWDYVVVCSKVYDGIPEAIAPAVSETTTIVLFQNGIGIEAAYHEKFPLNTLIAASVYVPVEQSQTQPGYVYHGKMEKLELGTCQIDSSLSRAREDLERFTHLLRSSGAVVEIPDDVQRSRWLKVAVNATWSPLCALTLLDDNNFIQSDPASLQIAAEVTAEVVAVAAAAGYGSLDIDGFQQQFGRSRGTLKPRGKEPSMLGDVRKGRQMEVEPIVGNVLKIGRELNVPTPRLDLLYQLLKGLNRALALNGQDAQTKSSVGLDIR